MKSSLLLTAFLCCTAAMAQTIRSPGSFTYTTLTAYSRQLPDAFSFNGNLGALGAVKQFSAGVWSERRFGISELSTHAVSLALPTSSGVFGFRGDYMGSLLYNESSLALAYGRSLGERVTVGLQFNYFSFRAAGYGGTGTVNADLGMLVQLAPGLNAGLQACNPVRTSWGKEGLETLPMIYRAGLGYEVSKQLYIGAEAEKVENMPVSIQAGMHYVIAEKLVARAGIRSGVPSYYLGFGVVLKRLRVDLTASLHPYLGLTPGLLLLYNGAE